MTRKEARNLKPGDKIRLIWRSTDQVAWPYGKIFTFKNFAKTIVSHSYIIVDNPMEQGALWNYTSWERVDSTPLDKEYEELFI